MCRNNLTTIGIQKSYFSGWLNLSIAKSIPTFYKTFDANSAAQRISLPILYMHKPLPLICAGKYKRAVVREEGGGGSVHVMIRHQVPLDWSPSD
jgi:hypothetical protein